MQTRLIIINSASPSSLSQTPLIIMIFDHLTQITLPQTLLTPGGTKPTLPEPLLTRQHISPNQMTPQWNSPPHTSKPNPNTSDPSTPHNNPFLRRPKSESSPEQAQINQHTSDLPNPKLPTSFQNFTLNVNSIISSNSPQHNKSNIFSRSQSHQPSSHSQDNSGDNHQKSLNPQTESDPRALPQNSKEPVLNTPKSMASDDRCKYFFGDSRGFERDNKADFILSKNFEADLGERGTLVSGRSEKSYGQLRREIQNCKTKESSVEVDKSEKLGISKTGGFVFKKEESAAIQEEEGEGSERSSERKGDFRELILSYIMEASKQRNIIKGYCTVK